MKSVGAYIEKIAGGGFQSSGVPDLIACYKGIFMAIEVKSPTGKGVASDIQKLKVLSIRKAGGVAFFADDMNDIEDVISQLELGKEVVDLHYEKDIKYF